MADYFVGDKLDKINKLIRKRIYFETNRRIFVPMTTNSDRYGWMSKTRPVNNWNPWIMSNWLMSTLLLEQNDQRRVDMVYAAMKGLDLYINGLGEDGGCDEGPSYWFAAGGSVFDCLELLDKSTDGNINIYKELGAEIINVALPMLDYAIATYYVIATAASGQIDAATAGGIVCWCHSCENGCCFNFMFG